MIHFHPIYFYLMQYLKWWSIKIYTSCIICLSCYVNILLCLGIFILYFPNHIERLFRLFSLSYFNCRYDRHSVLQFTVNITRKYAYTASQDTYEWTSISGSSIYRMRNIKWNTQSFALSQNCICALHAFR